MPADETRPRPAESSARARWFADYDEFFALRAPSVVRLARLQLQDNHAAEDVAAIVLEKVEKKWKRVSAMSAPDAYVRRMLVNECISYQRKAARRHEESVDPGSLPVVAQPDESATVAARDELRRALLGLPPQQRAVLVLRYYEEVPDQEIAEILGIARVTVRSHALYALTRLRRVLTVDGDA
jgi:RNA polymerase sigma-70 factor (sigma-E family)